MAVGVLILLDTRTVVVVEWSSKKQHEVGRRPMIATAASRAVLVCTIPIGVIAGLDYLLSEIGRAHV